MPPIPKKRCCGCKEFLLKNKFYKCRTRNDGLATVCKMCSRIFADRWRIKNPDKVKKIGTRRRKRLIESKDVKYYMMKRLGSSREHAKRKGYMPCSATIAELVNASTSDCQCCREHVGFSIYLDHCHKTGQFRGFICNRCNSVVGYGSDTSVKEQAMAKKTYRTMTLPESIYQWAVDNDPLKRPTAAPYLRDVLCAIAITFPNGIDIENPKEVEPDEEREEPINLPSGILEKLMKRIENSHRKKNPPVPREKEILVHILRRTWEKAANKKETWILGISEDSCLEKKMATSRVILHLEEQNHLLRYEVDYNKAKREGLIVPYLDRTYCFIRGCEWIQRGVSREINPLSDDE